MAGRGPNERSLAPGIRLVLEELRDLRVQMRAERRRADAERQRERRRSDERLEKVMRETRRAFQDVRTVGLSIVKTLNRHTRILERIERTLAGPGRWRPGGHGRDGGSQR